VLDILSEWISQHASTLHTVPTALETIHVEAMCLLRNSIPLMQADALARARYLFKEQFLCGERFVCALRIRLLRCNSRAVAERLRRFARTIKDGSGLYMCLLAIYVLI
jgi:hypothetical protein